MTGSTTRAPGGKRHAYIPVTVAISRKALKRSELNAATIAPVTLKPTVGKSLA